MKYSKKVEIRWSDLDPNFHLRHSAYYDFGAYCRVCFLFDHGVTSKVLHEHTIGAVLFREECFFKREIVFGDDVTVNLKLRSVSKDFRKFSFVHEIYKKETELAALLVVDLAWMHTGLRKITIPPEIIQRTFDFVEKTDDFVIT